MPIIYPGADTRVAKTPIIYPGADTRVAKTPIIYPGATTFADQFAHIVRLFPFAQHRQGHHAEVLLLLKLLFAFLDLDNTLCSLAL